MKKLSFMIEIHVLAKLGKQFCTESTCFNIVDGLYDCCKLILHSNKSCSVNHIMRFNSIEGFFLYLCIEFTLRPKYCQTIINPNTHKFFSWYTIVEINVKKTFTYIFALHVVSRGLQHSILY